MIIKSLDGDIRAFELLCKYGYGSKIDAGNEDDSLPTPILYSISTRNYGMVAEEESKSADRSHSDSPE